MKRVNTKESEGKRITGVTDDVSRYFRREEALKKKMKAATEGNAELEQKIASLSDALKSEREVVLFLMAELLV